MNRTAIAVAAWASALLALGSLALAGAWSSPIPALVLVGASVLPLLVLRGVVKLGISRWAAASVLALLLVLLAYLLTAGAGTSFRDTVTDAVPLLLSEPQPMPVRADLLAAPVLLAGAMSLLVGLRLGHRGRVAPVAAAAVLHTAGLLLTSGAGDPYGVFTGLLLVLALAGWTLLDDHTEPARRRTPVLAPLAAGAVAVAAVAAAVPVSNAFDPRDVVDTPTVRVQTANPLPQLGAWGANPRLELMRVTGPAEPIRLVTLTDHDGVTWTSRSRFARFGTTMPSGPPPGARQKSMTHQIELRNLVGPWLPTAGMPSQISVRDALLDPITGSVHLQEREDDYAYTVTSRVDAPTREERAGATVPTSGDLAAYLSVPDLPFNLAEYAAAATEGAATPYDRALAIEAAVRGNRKFSHKAISGSAYWRIERFLLGDRDAPGGQVGSSEQFATAFAIMARQNGLPTRIVVGFRPGEPQEDGSRIIHGEDALAWPEVYFEGLGWVPFSPLPDDATFAHDDVDRVPPEKKTQDPTPSDSPTAGDSKGPDPQQGAGGGPADPDSGQSSSPVPVLLVAAVAVLLPLVSLWLLRWRRSRRHRRHGARGGWAEVLDTLLLAGIPRRPEESATELALRADAALGTSAVSRLAVLAEADAFGPGPARADWPPEVHDVRRLARRLVSPWRRVVWSLDPRPLRR